jgi:hypothetical protein
MNQATDEPGYQEELSQEPGFRAAEQELRSSARLDAEEDERQAAQLAMRTRSLSEVAFEAMSRGDLIAAGLGDRMFTGRVVYSSGDLMTLEASGSTVDFNLQGPMQLRIIAPARSGGGGRQDGPGSFRGRLLELETERGELEVGSPVLPSGPRGTLQVAAQDHLVFRDAGGGEWFVPLTWVGYVARLKE